MSATSTAKSGITNLACRQPSIPDRGLGLPFSQPVLEVLNFFAVPFNESVGIDNFLLLGIELDALDPFSEEESAC
jgi:hypothetical protein